MVEAKLLSLPKKALRRSAHVFLARSISESVKPSLKTRFRTAFSFSIALSA